MINHFHYGDGLFLAKRHWQSKVSERKRELIKVLKKVFKNKLAASDLMSIIDSELAIELIDLRTQAKLKGVDSQKISGIRAYIKLMKKNSEKYNLTSKINRYEKIRELVEPSDGPNTGQEDAMTDQMIKSGNEEGGSGGKV